MPDSEFFSWIAGRSVEGRAIVVRSNFDPSDPPPANFTLLIGGQHGDEPATVDLLESFPVPAEPTAILSRANPDGIAAGTRTTARGVDPNRNCDFNWSPHSEEPPGPHPWSEPESRAVRDYILAFRPAKIVSLHWALAEIDADGAQSTPLAGVMWNALTADEQRVYRLRITEIGHGQRRLHRRYVACPGSLGQWCGFGLRYPDGSSPAMITLELPYDPSGDRPEALPDDHVEAAHRLWARDRDGYLRAVERGVHAMLAAACHHGRDST